MALKITLSEFSQQKLIENIEQPWFQEVLYVLRNLGSFAENSNLGSSKRPLTELEYQGMNGNFRQGWLTAAEAIPLLAKSTPKLPPEQPAPWGELKPEPTSPKVFQEKDNPQLIK